MQGQARTTGKTWLSLKVGEKQYILRPNMFGVLAEIEGYVIARRSDPLVEAVRACQVAPEEQHERIWTCALRLATRSRTVPAEEQSEFEQSVRGLAFKLWVCLRGDAGNGVDPSDPIKGVEQVMKILEEAGEQRIAEIAAAVQVASGMADVGNSSGRSGTPANPQAQKTEGQSTEVGPACTGSSSPSTT